MTTTNERPTLFSLEEMQNEVTRRAWQNFMGRPVFDVESRPRPVIEDIDAKKAAEEAKELMRFQALEKFRSVRNSVRRSERITREEVLKLLDEAVNTLQRI